MPDHLNLCKKLLTAHTGTTYRKLTSLLSDEIAELFVSAAPVRSCLDVLRLAPQGDEFVPIYVQPRPYTSNSKHANFKCNEFAGLNVRWKCDISQKSLFVSSP